MTSLYILQYNNYYNRILKIEQSLKDYLQYAVYTLTNANFNPNDNANTTHVFGSNANSYNGTGDYVVVVNEFEDIVSRWFIIDATRTRGGQYNLTLRRDLFADFYDNIINADMFIEKATLTYSDPLIFNSENMTFNQIKTSETLLKDGTGCPWLVGYYSKGQQALTGDVEVNTAEGYINIGKPIEEWDYYKYTNLGNNEVYNGTISNANYEIRAYERYNTNPLTFKFNITTLGNNPSYEPDNDSLITSVWFEGAKEARGDVAQNFANARRAWETDNGVNLNSYLPAYLGNRTTSEVNDLLYYNGKTIIAEGEVYTVKIRSNSRFKRVYVSLGNLFEALRNIADRAGFGWNTASPTGAFYVNADITEYSIELTRQQSLEVKYSVGGTGKLITTDAPWNIFAIPYGEVSVSLVDSSVINTSADIAIQTVMSIQHQHPGVVYDIQLLPYCPVPNLVTVNEGQMRCESEAQYSTIMQGTNVVGVVFNVSKSNFSVDIPIEILPAQTSIMRKVNNECDKWRVTSPNYSNYFDFSVEKNGGVSYFNVDCNYKPYTPYIHINPNFAGLYGYDDNSPRGLVLGGDFSLSQIIDQWNQYQIQNKNYQLTFDRQIQNMEVKNNVARFQEVFGAVAGTVQGAVQGAMGGSIGGAGGAIAGAVVGAGASAAGGILDYQMNELLRNEAMDYTKDLFGYTLGNIQALPNTISKISAFNANNKVFPVLEYYTATDREKEALINKVAYNGMTTMVIGKIVDYITNWTIDFNGKTYSSKGYIKCQLIRMEGIEDDYHIINSIAGELNKGVYI